MLHKPKYVFLDWIDPIKLSWDVLPWNILSSNYLELIQKYPKKINWKFIVHNENASIILDNNIKQINWKEASQSYYNFNII